MAIGLHMGISKSCLTLACGGREGSGAFLRALHLTGKKQTVQILSTKHRDCLHSCWSQEAPWLSEILLAAWLKDSRLVRGQGGDMSDIKDWLGDLS